MDAKREPYEELFILFSQKVEKYLKISIVVLAVGLLLMQLLLQHPVARFRLTRVEKLEGVKAEPAVWSGKIDLSFCIEGQGVV